MAKKPIIKSNIIKIFLKSSDCSNLLYDAKCSSDKVVNHVEPNSAILVRVTPYLFAGFNVNLKAFALGRYGAHLVQYEIDGELVDVHFVVKSYVPSAVEILLENGRDWALVNADDKTMQECVNVEIDINQVIA